MMTRIFPLAFSVLLAATTFGCSSTTAPEKDDADSTDLASTAEPPAQGTTVSGRVILAGDSTGVSFPITGVVSVEDVTYLDGPSTRMGSQTITFDSAAPTAFSISIPTIDPKASYSVQVRIDTDGDGKDSVGDYFSMQSYPVLNDWPAVRDVTAERYVATASP